MTKSKHGAIDLITGCLPAAGGAVAGLTLGAAAAWAIDYGVDMPDPGIPGYSFPESETNLVAWVDAGDSKRINTHAWGVWAALTSLSGRPAHGQADARVYQTWMTPGQILEATNSTESHALTADQRPLVLETPRQFSASDSTQAVAAQSTPDCGQGGKPDTCIVVTVNYSPPAAKHALENRLMWASTLQAYLDNGYVEIPNFPVAAVTVKPVYKVITQDKLRNGRLYVMPAWPGTPDPPKTFPETAWNEGCFYVDTENQGQGNGAVDWSCANPTPETTYNLEDFINIPITAADQAYYAKLTQGQAQVQPGDILILVAMHTTTREMTRWAWQTFFWTPSVNDPKLPSSAAIAADRPAELTGAPAHYAMSVAYQMLAPAHPLNGGRDVGSLHPAYNPYLEAGFAPDTFRVTRTVQTPTAPVTTEYGVQTNCMTCHGLAMYDPQMDYDGGGGAGRQVPYGANFYLGRDDAVFDGALKLDFAWSILGTVDTSK